MPAWNPTRVDFPTHIRLATLARQPVCMICHEAPSVEVDHIIGIAECRRRKLGNPNAMSNAQGLCADCHAKKTTEERAAGIRAQHAKLRHPGSRLPRQAF